MNVKLYLWSKSIHRITLFVTLFLTGIMSVTGLVLKYPSLGIFFPFDSVFVRSVHSVFSTYFAIVLGIMVLTGSYMYIFPLLRKPAPPKPAPPKPQTMPKPPTPAQQSQAQQPQQ